MLRLSCSFLLLLALASHTSHAAAQAQAGDALSRATARYLEADFAGAEAGVREVLDARASGAAELAAAYALRAVLSALEADDAPEVARAIELAVALDPQVAVPEGAPRALVARFEDARVARREAPLALVLEESAADRALVARVENAPEDLIARIEIVCDGAPPVRGEGRVALPSHAARCEATARTGADQSVRRTARDVSAPAASGGDDTLAIVLGVVGGVVVVGAAVGLAVALSSPGEVTLGMPRVIEW